MDRTAIREQAATRMRLIEERFINHVPAEAQSYWLLCYLIAEGFRSYFLNYSLLPIEADDAAAGRSLMNWGPLSLFEQDVLHFLDIKIREQESAYERKKRISLVE